jgi:uncharacterized protein YcbK (DUF882 family)
MPSRRSFLGALLGTCLLGAVNPALAAAPPRKPGVKAGTASPRNATSRLGAKAPRRLVMIHAHTGERLDLRWSGKQGAATRKAARRFFRDWRVGEEHEICPDLLDALADIQMRCGNRRLVLLSGYRSERTNDRLDGAESSQHLVGKAADIVIEGCGYADLARVVQAVALDRKLGHGFYPEGHGSFCHVDSGAFRSWPTAPGEVPPGVREARTRPVAPRRRGRSGHDGDLVS